MYAASSADLSEAAILDRVVSSFDFCLAVVCLVQDGLPELNVLAVFLDTGFDPVLDIERFVSVSRVVQSDRHNPYSQQVIVPVEDIVDTVSEHPDRCFDGERVMRDAHRRLLG